MIIDRVAAILSLCPNAEFVATNGVVTQWIKPTVSPVTDEQIDAELSRLQSDYAAKEYQRKRAFEYPAIGDQLDALFHAGVFPADMASKIQAVKDKYPKT